ncbi:hypothetical protein J437_LFUL013787 [Ladona fulva]|uniref:Craniofacial development protein 2-like n=1 Tax=Ladona fulva TaxID=123851 RepID=A0A8K0KDQ4_LADFU|nr:hypothetical protein J437_LFUL013787 [Ladona fulva]
MIIQVYMPSSIHDDEEVRSFYVEIDRALRGIKGEDNLIVMGDWNATVGEGRDGLAVGPFGLGISETQYAGNSKRSDREAKG